MLSESRLKVLEKIREFEEKGLFDKDVEDDPAAPQLMPKKVDYLCKKLSSRIMNKIANYAAVRFYEGLIKQGDFVIKEIRGIENFRAVKGGAVITCNHFSVLDNYAVWRAIRLEIPKGKLLYKVIKEGNYTANHGLFGLLFRHCNTLPLSSNMHTMKKFFSAVDTLLKRGEKILIYPEQAMWWNYRKPRPMKSGAFKLAVKSNVPVIPVFITMEDTSRLDADGYPVQAFTIHFAKAIYPNSKLSERENAEMIMDKNYTVWKEIYERVYNIPLIYEKK